ncbi:hypothetical protein JOD63_000466 [Microbacterium terrae]|uniref:DUF3105 domain-containing protein n=1 Tax=Microbacterium terrae TaxID=69369 RepID=A0A0M2GVH0_9MICO|nr:DUF3105 domain-containing protein [Microbacterium terrae]KJL37666.1 hypothetical protein RS81_03424 [Microbacterium terrae]MBP1076498.1 hypothetical protein [Microbacterium terrae]GLJ97327.1 membrane protein [Microbacterium terrae]
MTPTSQRPSDKRASGNPATQATINLTVKQQREQKKQEKLAEYQRQLAKRRRGKIVWWTVGITATLLVVALIVASIVFAPQPRERGDSDASAITGVETFEHTANHVDGDVAYEQTPPAGGDHNAIWLNCGVYTEPVPNVNAVHSLEHGAVWVTYDPAQVSEGDIAALDAKLPSTYTILSPYEGMDTPIAVSAWNAQLKVDSADDERIDEFITAFWQSTNAPEPGAACSGGLDAAGKQ